MPLPEWELRSVFESIARWERAKTRESGRTDPFEPYSGVVVRVNLHVEKAGAAERRNAENAHRPARGSGQEEMGDEPAGVLRHRAAIFADADSACIPTDSTR